MRNQYRNAEYYPDVTAGAAIENVTREERRVNRKPRKKPPVKRREPPCCKP